MTITENQTASEAAQAAYDPALAIAHFRAKLALETDASDVYADLQAGEAFVLIDTRSRAAWDQGHAAGAVHIPTRELEAVVPERYPAGTRFIVYCWSPGCNGADKAALALALLGYEAKLMIGGFEYWAREGYPVETALGTVRRDVDELVGPRSAGASSAISCDC
ncbi:MAG: rhodanese-like domain-containing protein [Leifsonia sp.]